jgi:hypothetical protein
MVWTQRLEEKLSCLCRGSNLDRPVVQSVARHYTDWATPAPRRNYYLGELTPWRKNPKVHYRTHNSPSPVPTLSQSNPIHTPQANLPKIHSDPILPPTPWSFERLFPSVFPTKTLYNCLSSPMRATFPAHLIRLDFICLMISGDEYKLCSSPIVQLPPFFRHLIPLRSKYSWAKRRKRIARDKYAIGWWSTGRPRESSNDNITTRNEAEPKKKQAYWCLQNRKKKKLSVQSSLSIRTTCPTHLIFLCVCIFLHSPVMFYASQI